MCSCRRRVRVINRCRETKRMNILQQKSGLPQFRCLPVLGGGNPASFRYERMIKGRWIPCNHSRVSGIVGVINRRGLAWTNESLSSIGVTAIITEKSSALLAMTVKTRESFTCATAMSMSVSAPCGSSKQNLRGCHER